MNIKGLLLGSAAVLAASTGARAADAIVIAEPEPMEYVRVCDMYGVGFFYIPGTETCLKIGGYMRYEVSYDDRPWLDFDGTVRDYRFGKFARFAPTFDARNETEWGTLRSFVEVEINWYSPQGLFDSYEGSETGINILHGFIELQSGPNTFLIGRTETPYSRFLGYAGPTLWEGSYGYNNTGEVSYTYTGGNGFSAIVAAVENGTGEFEPGIEGGVNFEQGWGSIGAIAGYDMAAESWGAKAVGRATFGSLEAMLQVSYGSEDTPGIYHIYDPDGFATEWSVLGGASYAFNDKIGIAGAVQWFDTDAWQVSANLPWTPVEGLAITPEVVYSTGDTFEDVWYGRVRFQRNF